MKLNKEFILKNLMGIICAVIILALFLPFMSVKAEVSVGGFGGGSADQSMNGFSLVTDGGFFGFAFILCLVAVAASCYIPQLKPFRKIISAIGSVAGIVCLFIAPAVFENIPLPDNPPIVHENDENIKEVINKQTADTEENLKEETAPTIDPAVGGIAISLFGQLTRMMTQDSNIDQSQFVNHSVETEILRKVLERKLAQGQKIE